MSYCYVRSNYWRELVVSAIMLLVKLSKNCYRDAQIYIRLFVYFMFYNSLYKFIYLSVITEGSVGCILAYSLKSI